MTERDALYQAVLANPDDDTPRLVFADLVEDEGEAEYARFIRTQIELAKVPEWDPTWVRYFFRERAMISGNGKFPLPPLPRGLSWDGSTYRRGFPAAVRAPFTTFMAHAADVFRIAPVEELELVGPEPHDQILDAAPLSAAPWSPRVRRLRLTLTSVDRDGVVQLATNPGLVGLAVTTGSADAFDAVFGPPLITRLTDLEVHGPGEAAEQALAAARAAGGPHQLRSVRLAFWGGREPSGLTAEWFDLPLFQGLGELNLSGNRLGPEGAVALARSVPTGLGSLILDDNEVGDDGVAALAGSARLAGLRRLSLKRCHIGPAGAAALARSPHLRELCVLDLEKNPFGSAGATALAKSAYLDQLLYLNLFSCRVNEAGVKNLLSSPLADRLLRLSEFDPEVDLPPALKRRLTIWSKRRLTS